MRRYKPRRASRRWLDGDCPAGMLAIFDHPQYADRYTVFYAEPVTGDSLSTMWLGYRGTSPQGVGHYGEMEAHKIAEYRRRNSHRAATWSSLPDAVKALVRSDIEPGELP